MLLLLVSFSIVIICFCIFVFNVIFLIINTENTSDKIDKDIIIHKVAVEKIDYKHHRNGKRTVTTYYVVVDVNGETQIFDIGNSQNGAYTKYKKGDIIDIYEYNENYALTKTLLYTKVGSNGFIDLGIICSFGLMVISFIFSVFLCINYIQNRSNVKVS